MTYQDKLAIIVGAANVDADPKSAAVYADDHSLSGSGTVGCIVRPGSRDEVRDVVRLAGETPVPLVPSSSGIHFHGASVPARGGLVMDLRRLNEIAEIDKINGAAHIEIGVNWGQLQDRLEAQGYRSIIPLLPHAERSVVSDWLERVPPVNQVTEYAEPLYSTRVVWGNGEDFVTGAASINNFREPGCFADGVNPCGPGSLNFHKLLQGAQGTLGVVTWAIVKIEEMPTLSRTKFIIPNRLEDAIEPLYTILRRRIGYECLLVNRVMLATMLAESPADITGLREVLPPWTVILVLSALKRRPEERIAYEEKALEDIRSTRFPDLTISDTLPGVPGVEQQLPKMLRRPWPTDRTYWKHAYRGGCQDLMFITTMERAPDFVASVLAVAARHDYPTEDVGVYLQPLENGRACQLEFSFYYTPDDAVGCEQVLALYLDAARDALDRGAYFNRPYPLVADMVYQRAPDYTGVLKRVKRLFDPGAVLNPGKLCFKEE